MLTASQFDALTTAIEDLYADFIEAVLIDIARRLAKAGRITATAAWQMQRLIESGGVYKDILERLAELVGQSDELLGRAFHEAGVRTIAFDDALYRKAGLNPPPIELSHPMQDVLMAGLRKTMGAVHNLTMTTAMSGQDAFVEALDMAYMQVSTGAMGYDQAIRAGVKDLLRNGLRVVGYGRHNDQVDVAVRRAVLTGVAQTAGELQWARVKEVGCTLVATSAHIGARPTHEEWQGRIFSVVGSTAEYPNFEESTGFGKVDGLCGVNCRHSFYPFYEGISQPAYSEATLDEYASKTVTYNGSEMSFYDATQKQRALEREIRKKKREAAVLGAAGLDNSDEVRRVRELQATLRDFCRQTGLIRQNVREGGRVQVVHGGQP